MKIRQKVFICMNQQIKGGSIMKVYKNGICREIDPKRKQEFQQKGYDIEGEKQKNTIESLQNENEKLKAELQELQVENEKLKTELQGGGECADTNGNTKDVKETTRGKK